MASTVETYEFPASTRGKHDWNAWLDGQIWVLTEGVDFDSKATSFRTSAMKQAGNRNKQLRFNVDGNKVYLQAIEKSA